MDPKDLKDFNDVIDDEEHLADVDVGYRTRGRPRLPPEQRRREKLVLSLTAPELARIMMEAARTKPRPLSPQDWARQVLLAQAPKEPES